jgi:drug/metabolite transporter (DMT)-like permease
MKHKLLLFPLITTLISGISIYLNAQLVKGIDPILQTTLKNGLVGLMVISTLIYSQKITRLKSLSSTQWLKLLIVALIGGSLSFGLFFTGLKNTGAVEGALIHKSMVVWIALMATSLLKEKLSPWMLLSAVGLFAVNFIDSTPFSTFTTAHLMVLSATLLWSIEAVIVKKFLSNLDVDLLLFGRMGLGSGILLAYTAATGKLGLITKLSSAQWWGLILVSLLLFGYVMTWYRALKYFSPVLVSSILVGATVITTAISSTTTGQLSGTQLIQSLLISSIVSSLVLFTHRHLSKPFIQLNRSV